MKKKKLLVVLATLGLVALPALAMANNGGGALPWEGSLSTLSSSITGPVATSIALIAIAVAGGVLIWGGEINRFASMAVYIVLVLGLLVMANNVLTGLGFTACEIPNNLATASPPTPVTINV